MNVGFIGTGSMGSILIEALIGSGALDPEQVTASNRTKAKAEALACKYPGLRAAVSNTHVMMNSDIVFLCIKPGEFRKVLDEIKHTAQPHQIVVSITSPVMIGQLEEQLDCKVAKMIPSITNYVRSGTILCMYGKRMSEADAELLESLLGQIGRPILVEERFTRVTSDISSCGPAFFAFLLQKFAAAAAAETGILPEQAVQLASEMLLGTGKLLTAGGMTPDELLKRVTVPGGITAAGLEILENGLNGVFHRMIRATHAKYEEDLVKIAAFFADEIAESAKDEG